MPVTMYSIIFSIIIPVYNVELYLRQCLESVLNQTYSDFEVVCVNDGSTDNSAAILNEYARNGARIKIIDQKNRGLSAARNAGIKGASGEYILLLDSDDWLEPNTLQTLADKQDGEDMVCFNGRRWFEDGTTETPDKGIEEQGMTGWNYYNKYALQPRKFHFVCTVLRLYKRTFLLKNNLFFKEGIYHEDNLFTPIACYYAQSVRVIPDTLYVYRIRQGSITQQNDSQRIFDLVQVANQLSAFFIPKDDVDKSILYREIAGEYFKGFMQEERQKYGDNDKQLKQSIDWKLFKSVSIYPRHRRIYMLLKISSLVFRQYLWIEKKLRLSKTNT
jgi:glycosyltransferase involved in cell wall biosynthesis